MTWLGYLTHYTWTYRDVYRQCAAEVTKRPRLSDHMYIWFNFLNASTVLMWIIVVPVYTFMLFKACGNCFERRVLGRKEENYVYAEEDVESKLVQEANQPLSYEQMINQYNTNYTS